MSPETPDPAVLDCRAAVRQLWDYLDGELAAGDADAVDAHLLACEKCPPHFRFERSLLDAVRAARAERSGGGVTALRARVVAALARDGFRVG
jgi:anti-sigma factor (TIGR02949 family)